MVMILMPVVRRDGLIRRPNMIVVAVLVISMSFGEGCVVIIVRNAAIIIRIMRFALSTMNMRSRLLKLNQVFLWRKGRHVLKKSDHRPYFLIGMSMPERGHAGHLHTVFRDPKQLRGIPLVHFFHKDRCRRI